MTGLAAFATPTANTTIADGPARRSISQTATALVAAGDISVKPEPTTLLDVLVNSHVVTRTADPAGYSFQHQQFQEWYASHFVEHRILIEIDDPMNRENLKAEVFDFLSWEEPILFAVERMARGNADQRAACGKAIVAAFEVAPLLAAEMIFRSTDQVWGHIASSEASISSPQDWMRSRMDVSEAELNGLLRSLSFSPGRRERICASVAIFREVILLERAITAATRLSPGIWATRWSSLP
jgi:hypothetical protein